MQLTTSPHFSSTLEWQSSAKAITNIVLAAAVTFGLFSMMAKLIEQDAERPVVDTTPVMTTVILDVEDKPTKEKPKIKPMEKPVDPPKTQLPQPKAVPGNTNNEFNVEPLSVNTTISINKTLGQGPQDMMARPVVRVNPSYPADAARDGIEGWVKLAFDLTPQGTVTNISVLDAQPKRVFDREARKALARWKYQPRIEDGVPLAQSGLHVILTFNLEK